MRLVDWDYLRTLLEEKLNIPGEILDYIAVKDILQLCASGSSNANIARFTNVEIEYVEQTLKEFFHFEGWRDDCDLNPFVLYKTCDGIWEDFEKEVTILYPYYTELEKTKLYLIASTYSKIEQDTEKYWI